jgi:hypothetical protein
LAVRLNAALRPKEGIVIIPHAIDINDKRDYALGACSLKRWLILAISATQR